jgi:hypothetical protein
LGSTPVIDAPVFRGKPFAGLAFAGTRDDDLLARPGIGEVRDFAVELFPGRAPSAEHHHLDEAQYGGNRRYARRGAHGWQSIPAAYDDREAGGKRQLSAISYRLSAISCNNAEPSGPFFR